MKKIKTLLTAGPNDLHLFVLIMVSSIVLVGCEMTKKEAKINSVHPAVPRIHQR